MSVVVRIAIVALALAACGDQRLTVALRSEVRDSAGVRIVENARPPDGSRLGWLVDSVPLVSIGTLEGDEAYLLHQVRGALTLPDGRIVVANRGSHELRVFDASGVHLGTWGGQGEGPGEFNSLVQVSNWPGDSLIAWYSQSDRRGRGGTVACVPGAPSRLGNAYLGIWKCVQGQDDPVHAHDPHRRMGGAVCRGPERQLRNQGL